MATLNIKPLARQSAGRTPGGRDENGFGYHHPRLGKRKTPTGRRYSGGRRQKGRPMTVKVGEKVLYGKYSGNEISVDGKKYLIMHESDIFAII